MSLNRRRPKPPRIFLSRSDHDRLDGMLGDIERTGAGALLRREVDRATILPDEANIDEGRVSVLSFVGAGLLGLKEGDGIDWPDASGRERRLTPILIEP